MAQLFALRRRADSSADWESVDPVLLERQLGFQITNGEGSRPLIKLGDGTTAWTNLPFITRKNNLAATTAPTTGNDGSEYYEIGSLWANVNDPDNPDLYILTDLSSGATWVQVNAGGGAGTLAATLVLGKTTGGEDIVISNGDVLDFSAVSAAGLLARIAAGNNYIYTKGSGSVAFKNVLTLFEAQSTTDSVLSIDQDTGEVEVGSPSYEGKFRVFSGTQDKKYILDVGNLTDNRIEVKPDAPIDWITGGATGAILVQQAGGSFKLQLNSLEGLSGVPAYPNDGDQYVLVEDYGSLTWEVYTAGGGSVDSVTGDSVDNTDPDNPVVNAIPLAGTEVGSPVTGQIEIGDDFIGFTQTSGVFTNNLWFQQDAGMGIEIIENGVSNANINFDSSQFILTSNDPLCKGFAGQIYFGANYTDNTYVQKKYVDDAIAAGGGGGIPLSGTTVGNPVTGDVEFEDEFKGVVMVSPNGTKFRLTVADDGTLTTTEL